MEGTSHPSSTKALPSRPAIDCAEAASACQGTTVEGKTKCVEEKKNLERSCSTRGFHRSDDGDRCVRLATGQFSSLNRATRPLTLFSARSPRSS